MKLNYRKVLIALLLMPLLGCTSIQEKAQKAAEEYNTRQQTYMETIADYNASAKELNAGIQELNDEINASQASINKDEDPFDPETLVTLKSVMTEAQQKLVAEAEVLPEYEPVTVNESDSEESLKALIEKTKEDIKAMDAVTVPEPVEVIDYSDILASLKEAHQAYDDSILSLKQITAPSDEFVMDRLKRIENITAMGAVTEDNDPNGKLNKAGGYIGTIYFRDANIDQSEMYPPNGTVFEVGTDGGGSIEIYPNVEDAESRNAYLATFDGSIFDSGAHHVYGTIIIRISDSLTASKQNEMTEKVLNALIEIDR